ncbi:putative transporter svop-1 isoform X2 [Pieris rapae]|uniref:putative transporter svop-1 isoform X2 n=1 Tax=Pieris rapae TaxID=64459 RepID=UPI001E27CD1D|nr:putative transporter svop-1 isoform X2 [Pieris rapae]
MDDITGEKLDFEEAINKTGFGKYNVCLLIVCCLLILAMYIDIFGLSIVLPDVACDMGLSTSQQGLLSAIPLIGVMISSYVWGLSADTIGRQKTLLLAMPVSIFWSLAASMTPTYTSLALLKLMSAGFSSSANAAAFVLLGETVPSAYRSKFMFLMASATMFVQLIISIVALPILQLSFSINMPLINLNYRPWRLLLQLITLPGIFGTIGIIWVRESPKFLLSKGHEKDAIDVLETIHKWNKGSREFKTADCSTTIQPMTLYAVMCYSGMSGTLNLLLTFIVGPLGKKRTTLLVFIIAIIAGILLLFVKQSIASIGLFFIFLYVALILGNVNTYLVELNPTQLRGMATCLSVVVARGFGFFSVQLIAALLSDHCSPMIGGYIALITSGLLIAMWLPADNSPSGNS